MSDTNAKNAPINPKWLAEFEAARKRPSEPHMKYAFIHTYKPVLRTSNNTHQVLGDWCRLRARVSAGAAAAFRVLKYAGTRETPTEPILWPRFYRDPAQNRGFRFEGF